MAKNNTGKLVVISDLHLWGSEDPLYRGLLRFIDAEIGFGDRLFIVGDLFDLFIGGKKIFCDRYKELLEQFRRLREKQVEIYYIEGNHDFHIESIFDDSPHIKLYSDTIHFEWDRRKFLFAHGDRINWKDFGYQFFRIVTHNLPVQILIDAVPGRLVDRIGRSLSKASRGSHPDPDEETVQMFRNYACEQISNGYDFVIMGHSHFHDDIRFRVADHEGQYINVGYPRKHRKYFEMRPGDTFFTAKSLEEYIYPHRVST